LVDTVDRTIFVFVRTDLPMADQMVQVGHVCAQAASMFAIPERCRLVLIGVESGRALRSAIEHCTRFDIRTSAFYECDSVSADVEEPMGLTAACTEPVGRIGRRHLRRFPLWA
jgi:hypothetical protein